MKPYIALLRRQTHLRGFQHGGRAKKEWYSSESEPESEPESGSSSETESDSTEEDEFLAVPQQAAKKAKGKDDDA